MNSSRIRPYHNVTCNRVIFKSEKGRVTSGLENLVLNSSLFGTSGPRIGYFNASLINVNIPHSSINWDKVDQEEYEILISIGADKGELTGNIIIDGEDILSYSFGFVLSLNMEKHKVNNIRIIPDETGWRDEISEIHNYYITFVNNSGIDKEKFPIVNDWYIDVQYKTLYKYI